MQRVVALRGGAPWRASPGLPLLLLPWMLALIFGSGGNPTYAQAPLLHDKQPPACDPDAPATYTAAVVEFSPALGVTLENIQERFRQNVQHYVEYAKAAKRQGAEIVVFPECGLVTLEMPVLPDNTLPVSLPLPPLGSNPCAEDSTFYPEELRELSCAARDAAIYIVVNLPEEEHCSPALSFCPECPGFDLSAVRSGIVACNLNGKRYFNSDIAFDRKGTVVAKYRKYNLFGEVGFVPPAEPSLEFFDSDFGPRFGLFTCFDLMFEQPAVALVTEAAVTDVVFPTAWFSELPFLTAVQAQAAWSWVLDVNFLGSGYNLPEVGSSGSGIYAGRRGKVVATMEREHTNKLLVGKLPNRNSCNFNATANELGCPRLQGKVVLLDRINWDPPPSPAPAAPIPQPCADMLPSSGDEVPSLYQCHLQTMIQLKGEHQTESDEEVEAEGEVKGEGEAEAEVVAEVVAEMVAEAVAEAAAMEGETQAVAEGEEGDGTQYELHLSRHGESNPEGQAEGDWEKEREAEDELREDEEEFKEAVAPAAPATLRQLIHGPRYRRYLQDVVVAGMRRLQTKSDSDNDEEGDSEEKILRFDDEEEIDSEEMYDEGEIETEEIDEGETEMYGEGFEPSRTAATMRQQAAALQEEQDEYVVVGEEVDEINMNELLEEAIHAGVRKEDEDLLRDILREQVESEGEDILMDAMRAEIREDKANYLLDTVDEELERIDIQEEMDMLSNRNLQMEQKQEKPRVTDQKDEGADERYADYVRRCEDKVKDTKDDAQTPKTIECPNDSSPSNVFGEDEDNWDEMREEPVHAEKGVEVPVYEEEVAEEPAYEEERAEEPVYEEDVAVELVYEEAEEPINEGEAEKPVYEEKIDEELVYEEERAEEPLNEDDKLDEHVAGIIDELVDEATREDEIPDEQEYPEGEADETEPGCQCEHEPSEQKAGEISQASEAKTKAWLEQPGVSGPSIARERGYLYLKTEDLSQYVSSLLPATGDDVWVVENSSIYLCHGAFCCDFQIVMTMSGRDADADSDSKDGDGDADCACGPTDPAEQVQELEQLVMELIPEEEIPPPSSPLETPPIEEAVEEVEAWEAAEPEVPQKEELKDLRYFYRAVVFNGQRTFDGVTEGGLQVCGIITCTGTDMESCGKLHAGEDTAQEATFRSVRISGRFARGHALPLPSTLDAQLMPLPPDSFSLKATVRRKETELVMESQKELRFITFGIYNRNFANDPERQATVG